MLHSVVQYSSVIIGQFYGHMHRDDLRVIWPEGDRQDAALVILEAPSIAPNSDTNPSFRFYYYNTSNYALIDYDEYYTDLINNYIAGEIVWRLEYSFNDAYNVRLRSRGGRCTRLTAGRDRVDAGD